MDFTRPEAGLSQNTISLPGNKGVSREKKRRFLVQKRESKVCLLAIPAQGSPGGGSQAASHMSITDFSRFSAFALCSL